MAKVGILGGSGLYDLAGMEAVEKRELSTPFGDPSDAYVCGTLGGVEVCFLPRHGVGHRVLPSEINHRANIMGFKMLGVERVISVSAVGSLREDIHPRDLLLPDQYLDRTKHALSHTFFGKGIVAHVGFGEPACSDLRRIIAETAADVLQARSEEDRPALHVGGTYVSMEGPAFSTKAESCFYRTLDCSVIGMTSLPEAKLCREAELCYQAIAMVTDYDCWHESEEAVTVEMVLGHLNANTIFARELLSRVLPRVAGDRHCVCGDALKHALITQADAMPTDTKANLQPIIGKYLA
ncbi:MAG: S-methyl-5'-thioadenosine phosphorylase [Kiritimatiellae bacterium]|nr:S-methyl-5'-thioadenosine phosphorylase [Kiritimatiellia bacterium]